MEKCMSVFSLTVSYKIIILIDFKTKLIMDPFHRLRWHVYTIINIIKSCKAFNIEIFKEFIVHLYYNLCYITLTFNFRKLVSAVAWVLFYTMAALGVRGKFYIFPLNVISLSIFFFSFGKKYYRGVFLLLYLSKWECTNFICCSFCSALNKFTQLWRSLEIWKRFINLSIKLAKCTNFHVAY